jgi:hypothetical protein
MSECRTKTGLPKVRYQTRATAKATAKLYPDAHMQPYRCNQCGWFHLGHYLTGTAREWLRQRHRTAS